MKNNMGSLDKTVRILVASVIVILYFAGILTGTLAIILLIIAGIFVLTSSISFCPLYWPFGISTLKKRRQEN